MLFEETAPPGTKSWFHLHRDSDEIAYVLSGEVTFLIGGEVTVGGPGACAFMPRGVPLEEHRSGNRPRAVSLCAGQGRRVHRGAASHRADSRIDDRERAGRDAPALWLGAARTIAALSPRPRRRPY
jgi:uncharacterized cupin superfamily protein